MTSSSRVCLVAALALCIASSAGAQGQPVVSLVPDTLPRWDVSGHVGWLGVNKSEIAPDWNEWYDAGSFGASAGFHWTHNLKIELDVSTTTEATVFVQEQIFVPGEPTPFLRVGEHEFRSTSVGGALVYQFFENRWFHPFLGAGIDVTRENARNNLRWQPQCVRAPCTPFAPLPVETSVTHLTRPFAIGGFKWYVSERAFIRSDIRTSFSSDGAEAVTWRGGIGVDF